MCKVPLGQFLDFVIERFFNGPERLQLSRTIVDNSHRGAEAQFQSTFSNRHGVLGILYATA